MKLYKPNSGPGSRRQDTEPDHQKQPLVTRYRGVGCLPPASAATTTVTNLSTGVSGAEMRNYFDAALGHHPAHVASKPGRMPACSQKNLTNSSEPPEPFRRLKCLEESMPRRSRSISRGHACSGCSFHDVFTTKFNPRMHSGELFRGASHFIRKAGYAGAPTK
jgi:hypothetical protein